MKQSGFPDALSQSGYQVVARRIALSKPKKRCGLIEWPRSLLWPDLTRALMRNSRLIRPSCSRPGRNRVMSAYYFHAEEPFTMRLAQITVGRKIIPAQRKDIEVRGRSGKSRSAQLTMHLAVSPLQVTSVSDNGLPLNETNLHNSLSFSGTRARLRRPHSSRPPQTRLS